MYHQHCPQKHEAFILYIDEIEAIKKNKQPNKKTNNQERDDLSFS